MKTTVEIPDTLMKEARKLASKQHTSLRVLIVEGLRRVLTERRQSGDFRLRKATFKGTGLKPEAAGASWERLRDMTYEGRGG
jgi:hypothetical protein